MKTNKTWFITGTSRGFGTIIARAALEAGDNVIGTGRRAADVIRALGASDRLLAVDLDVNDEAAAAAAVKAGVERFGRIDILVNNAGFGILGGVEETSAADVEAVFRTNVFGLLSVTRAVLPQMRRQRSGHIVNLSSIGGYQAYIGWGVYGATKFAVEGLTEAMALELAPLGIFATTVLPGFFRTDFLDAKSLTTAQTSIPDYADTVGAMRSAMGDANHQQPNNPAKIGPALLKLVNHPKPPVRLLLGPDTIEAVEKKNAFVAKELAEWRDVAASTGF